MKIKKILTVFGLLLYGSTLLAQQRNSDMAMLIAREFFASKGASQEPQLAIMESPRIESKRSKRREETTNTISRDDSYYIVNDYANNRFVIVSKDEQMLTILGYSESGTFDEQTAPPGLLDMLAEYNLQYDAMERTGERIIEQSPQTSTVPIPYMIKTTWDQKEPFWNDCPHDSNGKNCVTGCVATAMAQIMNYHKWPLNGSGGIVSYESRPYITEIAQSFNFDELIIDWNNMVDSYNQTTTQSQNSEVAKLMHACGVSVYMDYDSSESGADPADIAYALINNFGYNPNIYYAEKEYYTSEEWNEIILSELKINRPILYGGGDHQFILDGAEEDGRYHLNFGWNGSCDGWYVLDAIVTRNGDFSSGQSMVVGICPQEAGIKRDVFYADDFMLEGGAAVGNKTKITSLPVWCFSSEANTMKGKAQFQGEYGIGAFDKKHNFVKSLYRSSTSCYARTKQSKSGSSVAVSFDEAIFTEGSEYLLRPYAKSSNSSQPTIMRNKPEKEIWYKATVKAGKVLLEKGGEFTTDEKKLGDSNGDGVIDVADIVNIVNYIMMKPMSNFIFENSDMDYDGIIDVADITIVVNKIMNP